MTKKSPRLKNVNLSQIKKNLDVNIRLILDYLEREEGKMCSDIFALSLSKCKIVEICDHFNLSRFKVKKYLGKAKKLSKRICVKEGMYGKNKKISGLKKKK